MLKTIKKNSFNPTLCSHQFEFEALVALIALFSDCIVKNLYKTHSSETTSRWTQLVTSW